MLALCCLRHKTSVIKHFTNLAFCDSSYRLAISNHPNCQSTLSIHRWCVMDLRIDPMESTQKNQVLQNKKTITLWTSYTVNLFAFNGYQPFIPNKGWTSDLHYSRPSVHTMVGKKMMLCESLRKNACMLSSDEGPVVCGGQRINIGIVLPLAFNKIPEGAMFVLGFIFTHRKFILFSVCN